MFQISINDSRLQLSRLAVIFTCVIKNVNSVPINVFMVYLIDE